MGDLLSLHQCFLNKSDSDLQGEVISFDLLEKSWQAFIQTYCSLYKPMQQPRDLLTIASILLRSFETINGKFSFEKWWSDQKKDLTLPTPLTSSSLADKIYRLFICAAAIQRKRRIFQQLLNADMLIHESRTIVSLKRFLKQYVIIESQPLLIALGYPFIHCV